MVIPHIRLWEGGIDQIIGCGILVVPERAWWQTGCPAARNRPWRCPASRSAYLPRIRNCHRTRRQAYGISRKFGVEAIYDLFDVHFCHSALLLLNLRSDLPSESYDQLNLKVSHIITDNLSLQQLFAGVYRKHFYHSKHWSHKKDMCRSRLQFFAPAPVSFACPSNMSSKSGFEDRLSV